MKCNLSFNTKLGLGLGLLLATAASWGCNGNGAGEGCPTGLLDCDGLCRDVQVDPNNCGSCGNVCGEGELCSAGICTLTCPAGFTECSGSCVDTDTDPFNCGGCGQPCYRGEDCVDGECTASATCGDGTVDEGEACDDGNADNTDACLDTCENASCGDGFVQTGVEACDDGNADNDDTCLTTCAEASCGDGYIQTGVEACDDGNTTSRDGCSENCLEELSCLVTLDGGRAARLSSVSVESNGQMTVLGSVTVAGSHVPSPLTPTFAQAMAVCGNWVYAAISDSEEIQQIITALDGTLTAGASIPSTDVQGLVCDSDTGLLFAYSITDFDQIEARSYSLDASGTPALIDSETYILDSGISFYEIRNAGMPRHPVSGDLWLLYAWGEIPMSPDLGIRGVRLSYSSSGILTTEEAPVDICYIDIAYSFTFSPDGSKLVMPGYGAGGCLAWHDSSGLSLPASGSEIFGCSDPWDEGIRVTVRSESNIFYLTYSSSTTIRIGEFDSAGPVNRGTATAAANASHLQLLYDDSVLVSLGRDGNLRSFTSSTDGLTLTAVDDVSLGTTSYLDSSVVVACTP